MTDVSEKLTASIIRAINTAVSIYQTARRNIPEDRDLQKNPIPTIIPYLFDINFNIILPSTPMSHK
jgi:hypothetical protein